MSFVFNLQTVSTARRRCLSSLSWPDVVGFGREVAEKTTSILRAKKKKLPLMKLYENPEIPNQKSSH
jgi:hypothetical protein